MKGINYNYGRGVIVTNRLTFGNCTLSVHTRSKSNHLCKYTEVKKDGHVSYSFIQPCNSKRPWI